MFNLKKFENLTDYNNYINSNNVILPNISVCSSNGTDIDSIHQITVTDYYEKKYFAFTALESGTFKFYDQANVNTLSYSLDNGSTWVQLANNTDTPVVSAGNKILWKGELIPQTNTWGSGQFFSSGRFDVEGNIMSLIYGDNFEDKISLENKNDMFRSLFENNTNIINANKLTLPATILSDNCYRNFFKNCTSLLNTPELPAKNLTTNCYMRFCLGCTSLVKAPILKSINLAPYCYYAMFMNCENLVDFQSILPATTLTNYCYDSMLVNTRLVIAPKLPATILTYSCYGFMFEFCSNLEVAPELPAKDVLGRSYYQMFKDCPKITYIKCLAETVKSDSIKEILLNGSSTGTIIISNNYPSSNFLNHIPSGWQIFNTSGNEIVRE